MFDPRRDNPLNPLFDRDSDTAKEIFRKELNPVKRFERRREIMALKSDSNALNISSWKFCRHIECLG
jgi:hypothetical protein